MRSSHIVLPRRIESRQYKIAVGTNAHALTLASVLSDLYIRRSETVHKGKVEGTLDLRSAQAAFVFAFIGIVRRLGALPNVSSQPITDIRGNHEKESWWRKLQFWCVMQFRKLTKS